MKTLTVRQPHASRIASGKKTIEVRTWRTRYRGPLLITASARKHGALPTACQLCVVDLVDVRPITAADSFAACCEVAGHEFAWVLANPRQVRQHAIKGRLSIWDGPEPEYV